MSRSVTARTQLRGRQPAPDFWKDRRVCVTGGSGFLGYHLVQQLLGLGARVLTLRPQPTHPLLAQRAVEVCCGDVRDAALVRRAVADCDVIFHTAAVVAVSGPGLRHMQAISLEGTRNVLAAARSDARIVHTSSIVAVGASPRPEPLTEDSPYELDHLAVAYVQSKRAAERLALEASGRQHVVVANPTFMLGPEDYGPSDMGRFCLRFWKGHVPLALSGGFNLVDVRDVARGHLLAAEHGRPGRRYLLGGEDRTIAELLQLLAKTAALNPRWLPQLPDWLLGPLAAAATGLAWWQGKPCYPTFQHLWLHRYYWFARSDRAIQELGYQPRPVASALADTYAWCRTISRLRLRGLRSWWLRPVPTARAG